MTHANCLHDSVIAGKQRWKVQQSIGSHAATFFQNQFPLSYPYVFFGSFSSSYMFLSAFLRNPPEMKYVGSYSLVVFASYRKTNQEKYVARDENCVLRITAYVQASATGERKTMMERSGPIDDWLFYFIFFSSLSNVSTKCFGLPSLSAGLCICAWMSLGCCCCVLSTAGHLNVPPRT